ncbi:AzlD domain-containing protein [Shinella sp. PSBB067]|uniref:AzlD domain-containing protein n=1 Tax=unclassified Shinella TaxID=2643062 RepID=UPI00193B4836|nr:MULTISPECIES: AzlD domain-containing protein [unclassified Shinella]QRI62236.1 AzlD domain-containing protein [Shinella sp. PSBB067]
MTGSFLVTVAICAAMTICVRALPIVFLAGVRLPAFAMAWLGFIPSAIMMAIVTLELVKYAGEPGGTAATVAAAAGCAAVAFLTRSLFGTVLVGVAVYLAFMVLP